jgi:rare lipoprotein A (peptidoglycan hydrolase)
VSPEKGGALRNQSTGGRRLGVAAVICGALFGAPLLLLHSNAATASRSEAAAHVDHGARKTAVYPSSHLDTVKLPSHLVAYHAAGSTTTTTAPPTTTTTAPPTTTTTAPPTTTTLPPTTTTTTRPAPRNSEVGDATWYAAAPAGYCASPTLPFGTVLTVVNNATGATTVCTVDDREAAGYPRVVDLSPEGFDQIASTSQGVVQVTISW